MFIPLLDAKGVSTQRTILEVSLCLNMSHLQEFDIIFPPSKAVKPKADNLQIPILPPLRSADGIHVPDLSGLRLRFAKHADTRLTLSMGISSVYKNNNSGGFGG
jgi:hypothetical protein